MKLLVTGGAGFIGSNFILYWMKNYPQDRIVNLDNLTYAGNLENLKEVEKNPNYKFIHGNICNLNIVGEAMRGIDTVVHFAAESHVDRSILKPSDFIVTNVVGTQVLLDSALKHKVKRFHHISTDEVYGSLKLNDQSKFNERTNYNPNSPYSASKAGSDHLVKAYSETYGLPITITNCSNNFGPYQFPEKFIPLAITNILEDKKVPVYGDGLYVRDWLYVIDHCRAIDLVLNKGKVGETYLVGGMTDDISNLEVVKKILKIMGKPESFVEHVKDRLGHDRRYAVNWSKIEKELGWKPLHDFDEWLEKTIAWYKENEKWWKDVKSGDYKKYYQEQYGKL
ncbi:MAG: dTDP-glucose 4,6-dehydratase [Candidatus Levybacteria bacterium RIFCSPLOWO2_01_FULL_39_24]|nr:MAG: dTDP-glucose 4,6-dehydratase [Candidatus Levybacteria bacterium RIFCSPHIGHO2_01_FULL_40_16]OGH28624.1 MAG: dTDP-glucose 4,6-dehydratase [Candidatus Levybacteria bacterium RIFCSPHIGHO2_12_FULL_39_9]OGH46013.1 MAG: dTDP-glucose 4,6-dehydratase [Candidatus Levybacteria bacterium RIFCSPLOWO2_01_FULL_39_24]